MNIYFTIFLLIDSVRYFHVNLMSNIVQKGNAPEKNISRRPDLKAISKASLFSWAKFSNGSNLYNYALI